MRFQIKAVRKPAVIVEALLDAPSQADAILMARAQGMRVLSITAQQDWFAAHRRQAQAFPLLLFAQELVTLLRAGLPLIDTIESLADKEHQLQHKKVLDGLTRALQEGQSRTDQGNKEIREGGQLKTQSLGERKLWCSESFVAVCHATLLFA